RVPRAWCESRHPDEVRDVERQLNRPERPPDAISIVTPWARAPPPTWQGSPALVEVSLPNRLSGRVQGYATQEGVEGAGLDGVVLIGDELGTEYRKAARVVRRAERNRDVQLLELGWVATRVQKNRIGLARRQIQERLEGQDRAPG